MQQLAHMFYAMVFLTQGSSGKPIDWDDPLPAYIDFQRRFWTREVHPADTHSKTMYGRMQWEELRPNLRQPKFDEALRIGAKERAV